MDDYGLRPMRGANKQCGEKWADTHKYIVDAWVLQIMAERRDYERKGLHVGETIHNAAKQGEAVGRLRHVKDMEPVVVRVVQHAISHTDDEPLQLVD